MEPLTTILLYSLRFVVILSAVLLWVVALSDIKSRVRKGAFTITQLSLMAVAVSVAAAGTLVSANAVVRPTETEASPETFASAPRVKTGCEGPTYTFTYSFGLERPANAPQDCAAKPPEASPSPHP
jgi:hypothetical protein